MRPELMAVCALQHIICLLPVCEYGSQGKSVMAAAAVPSAQQLFRCVHVRCAKAVPKRNQCCETHYELG